jgi:HEAT repeat protein
VLDRDLRGTHFSGARLDGSIALLTADAVAFEAEFSGEVKVPWQINRAYRRPEDAPFDGTLPGFCAGMFRAVAAVRGPAPLAAALGHAQFPIRLGALRALIWEGDASTVDALVPLLRANSDLVRMAAAQALGAIGDGRALPALLDVLDDGDADTRDRLFRESHPSILQQLIDVDYGLYPSVDRTERSEGAEALEGLSDVTPRHAVLWAAYQVNAPDKRERLVRALRDPGSVMRRVSAANLLGALEDRQAVEPLMAALQDRWFLVRAAAATALGRIGDERALPALSAAAGNGNAFEKSCVTTAMDRIGRGRWEAYLRAEGVPVEEHSNQPLPAAVVLRALADADPLIRAAAVPAAKAHLATDPAVRAALIRCARDSARSVRAAAVFELTFLDDDALADTMLAALRDDDEEVRVHAARYFEGKPDRRATPGLVAMLSSADDGIREAAVQALGRAGDPAAVEPLMNLANDYHSLVQEAVVAALDEIGDPRARPALERMSKEGMTVEVQIAAGEALDRLGDGRSAADLLTELPRARPRLRESLARAIGRTGDAAAVEGLIALLPEQPATAAEEEGQAGDREIGLSLEEAARLALRGLTGEDFATAPEWRRWWSANRDRPLPPRTEADAR